MVNSQHNLCACSIVYIQNCLVLSLAAESYGPWYSWCPFHTILSFPVLSYYQYHYIYIDYTMSPLLYV